MTVRAIYVHKSLRGSYIDALFRRVFRQLLGIKPEQPLPPVGPDAIVVSDQRSGSGLLRGTGLLLTAQSRLADRHFSAFLQTDFPSAVQSVSIRGVSTKLKVNYGRTSPPVYLP